MYYYASAYWAVSAFGNIITHFFFVALLCYYLSQSMDAKFSKTFKSVFPYKKNKEK